MINVQQITSQLARLPDQALQQYAAMHKNDPYIMALALSESNRRKQMREGAQMAAPEQPKVVDQEIANMAAPMPEDVGIAQLPMNNPGYASGGIVAFGDGGEVERYQDRGLVRPGPGVFAEDPRLAREAFNRARLYYTFNRLGVPLPVVGAGFEAAAAAGPAAALGLIPAGMAYGLTSAMRESQAQGYPTDPMGEFSSGAMTPAQAVFDADRRQRLLREQAQRKAEEARYSALVEGREPPQTATTAPAVSPASPDADFPSAARTRAAPNVDTTGAGGTRPPRPTAPAAPAAAAGLPSLDVGKMTKDALEAAAKAPNPFAKDIEALGKERVKAKEEEAAGVEAIQKRFDDIFKGRKERLDTREAELGKMKDQGIGLALLQAGAAMMSTPGGLGVALGKGVKVGTEQYASGLERLRSAQEKLSDARDRLEETEAQRGEMSARELLKARTEVKNAGISAREEMIKSNMQMYGVNRDTAMKMVDNQIQVGIAQFREAEATKRTGMEIEGRERAARTAAGAQQSLYEALGRAAPGSPLLRGYEMAKQEGQLPRLYGEYTKRLADPIEGSAFEQKYPTFEAFIAGMGGNRAPGFVQPPANAPVLRPPTK